MAKLPPFPGTTGRQDYKAKGEGGHAILFAEASVHGRRVVYADCLVMLDAPDLRLGREYLVEVATPPSRILALPVAAHLGPIQHALDKTTNS